MLETLTQTIAHSTKVQRILEHVRTGQDVSVTGVVGSSTQVVAAVIARELFDSGRQMIVLVPESSTYASVWDDLSCLLRISPDGEEEPPGILCYPEDELLPYDEREMSASLAALRQQCLEKLLTGGPALVVTTGRALSRKAPAPDLLRTHEIDIRTGQHLDFERFTVALRQMGFEREDVVASVGAYAVRGGIVDLYPFSADTGVRIEFDGDAVASVRSFDLVTQRSTAKMEGVTVYPRSHQGSADQTASLLDYCAGDALVAISEPDVSQGVLEEYWEQIEDRRAQSSGDGEAAVTEPGRLYWTAAQLQQRLSAFQQVEFCRLSSKRYAEVDLAVKGITPFNGHLKLLRDELARREPHEQVYILCSNAGQAERLSELLDGPGIEVGVDYRIGLGELHEGFQWSEPRIKVWTDHQIFGRIKRPRVHRRFRSAQALRHVHALKPGDFVVHVDHGIARYAGLEKITHDHTEECLKLIYDGGDKLFVPLEHFKRVQKYSAEEGVRPKLNKLGSTDWGRLKARTKKCIKDIAHELIKLYAERKSREGHRFSADTHLQFQMEASFEFEDTPDQTKVTEEIKKDMESETPMDRLVCGDVGYGKTEVAVRAAFKSVLDSKQVAVLVPTTILADQHFETFSNRLREFPVRVDVLSRFRTAKEQKDILHRAQSGAIDILIGTHRLLSGDVAFKDLGLLIIDEEQRFGVAHKEKLRQLRATVDTLTLTATPIPRTLHFSLMGGRDLSLINTPPHDRLPIKTEITQFNEDLVHHAITQELDRGGQVYFVHNRIQTIERVAAMLHEIVPRARLAIVHGQMAAAKIENVLHDFMKRKYDVLIATAIIENGIDIPNVNTILVDQAHHFGLAQLYQLRGRVGRSNRQAYCYLLTTPFGSMPADALAKLQAIEEFTDLGSGFLIAMRDLEIRGAGNLLGAEQSGFVNAVGFELYCQILHEAVSEVRNEQDIVDRTEVLTEPTLEVHIEAFFDTYIPDRFVNVPSERVRIYKQLSEVSRSDTLIEIEQELTDRFGPLPDEVRHLLRLVEIKLLAASYGFDTVRIQRDRAVFEFSARVLNDRFPAETMRSRLGAILQSRSNLRLVQDKKSLNVLLGYPWYDVQKNKPLDNRPPVPERAVLEWCREWLRGLVGMTDGSQLHERPVQEPA
jgi:transcription-repair coupling factor (superfamily II helicase)